MNKTRRCTRCGRLLAVAAIACSMCTAAAPPAPVAHHALAVTAVAVEHSEPPHLPEREVVTVADVNHPAAYPPPAPFTQQQAHRAKPQTPRRGRWRGTYPVVQPDGTNRLVTIGN